MVKFVIKDIYHAECYVFLIVIVQNLLQYSKFFSVWRHWYSY